MQPECNSHAKLRFTTWMRAVSWKDRKQKENSEKQRKKGKPNAAEASTSISPSHYQSPLPCPSTDFCLTVFSYVFFGPWLVAAIFILLIVTNCVAHATCCTCVCVRVCVCQRVSFGLLLAHTTYLLPAGCHLLLSTKCWHIFLLYAASLI